MPVTALITGASGRIGSMVRPLLRERGWALRLLDVAPPPDPDPSEVIIAGSFLDEALLARACTGVDVVVHLAAHASERPWDDILSLNIDGTRRVLEAARDAGVRNVLLASSVHAVGFLPFAPVDGTPLPRPDSYYGVSKAAAELLGSLFADRFDMRVVTARICYAVPEVPDGFAAGRIMWLSPGDATRLIAATAALDAPGHHVVWGVSLGASGLVDYAAGHAIGFDPQDDARLPGDTIADAGRGVFGGEFAELPLGVDWGRR